MQPPEDAGHTNEDASELSTNSPEENSFKSLFQEALGLIARDTARKQPLPRSASFASQFREGIVDMKDRDSIKSRAIGTDLLPSDDVREMDSMVPREPELESETEEEDPL